MPETFDITPHSAHSVEETGAPAGEAESLRESDISIIQKWLQGHPYIIIALNSFTFACASDSGMPVNPAEGGGVPGNGKSKDGICAVDPPPGKDTDPELAEAMVEAACNGETEQVLDFLSSGVSINAQNHNGMTVLICASSNGNIDVVRALLDYCPDLNIQDQEGLTALHHAVLFMEYEIAHMLIAAGADTEMEDIYGTTALLFAAFWNFDDYFDFAELLLKAGADVDHADNYGYTPLMAVAVNGDIAMAALFLQYGADINLRDDFGYSALDYAIENGNDEMADFLRNKGAA